MVFWAFLDFLGGLPDFLLYGITYKEVASSSKSSLLNYSSSSCTRTDQNLETILASTSMELESVSLAADPNAAAAISEELFVALVSGEAIASFKFHGTQATKSIIMKQV